MCGRYWIDETEETRAIAEEMERSALTARWRERVILVRQETSPEDIAAMQTRAVMEAAIEVKDEDGFDIQPEIMIPLVGDKKELAFVKKTVVATAE